MARLRKTWEFERWTVASVSLGVTCEHQFSQIKSFFAVTFSHPPSRKEPKLISQYDKSWLIMGTRRGAGPRGFCSSCNFHPMFSVPLINMSPLNHTSNFFPNYQLCPCPSTQVPHTTGPVQDATDRPLGCNWNRCQPWLSGVWFRTGFHQLPPERCDKQTCETRLLWLPVHQGFLWSDPYLCMWDPHTAVQYQWSTVIVSSWQC